MESDAEVGQAGLGADGGKLGIVDDDFVAGKLVLPGLDGGKGEVEPGLGVIVGVARLLGHISIVRGTKMNTLSSKFPLRVHANFCFLRALRRVLYTGVGRLHGYRKKAIEPQMALVGCGRGTHRGLFCRSVSHAGSPACARSGSFARAAGEHHQHQRQGRAGSQY